MVQCKDCRFKHDLAEDNHYCKLHEETVELTDLCMQGKPIEGSSPSSPS